MRSGILLPAVDELRLLLSVSTLGERDKEWRAFWGVQQEGFWIETKDENQVDYFYPRDDFM